MYSAKISRYVVMIYSFSCRFPVDIAAQVSTWQMNVTSVSSVVTNLISMPGNPLSTSSGIGAPFAAKVLTSTQPIVTNNLPFFFLASSTANSTCLFLLGFRRHTRFVLPMLVYCLLVCDVDNLADLVEAHMELVEDQFVDDLINMRW